MSTKLLHPNPFVHALLMVVGTLLVAVAIPVIAVIATIAVVFALPLVPFYSWNQAKFELTKEEGDESGAVRDVKGTLDEIGPDAVPVNSALTPPVFPSRTWTWSADSLNPLTGLTREAYVAESEDKAALLSFVDDHVLPLYEAAVTNLERHGENTLWEEQQ